MAYSSKQWVKDLLSKVLKKVLPFRLGIDEDGNYGYYKAGADTLTPFKSGSNVEEILLTSHYDWSFKQNGEWTALSGTELAKYVNEHSKYFRIDVSTGWVYVYLREDCKLLVQSKSDRVDYSVKEFTEYEKDKQFGPYGSQAGYYHLYLAMPK